MTLSDEVAVAAAPAARSGQVAGTGADDARLGRLMAAAQGGDRSAYDAVLRASIPLIQRFARRLRVPPSSADDVVQDVLLTIHRVRHTFDPGRSYAAWLASITRHRAIDLLRRQGRTFARELNVPLAYENHADETDPSQPVERDSAARQLGLAIAALPEGQRQAVETLGIAEHSLAEAAELTGRSKGALKVNFHRALRSLQARLAGRSTGDMT